MGVCVEVMRMTQDSRLQFRRREPGDEKTRRKNMRVQERIGTWEMERKRKLVSGFHVCVVGWWPDGASQQYRRKKPLA